MDVRLGFEQGPEFKGMTRILLIGNVITTYYAGFMYIDRA
jgi:hypothetical protein